MEARIEAVLPRTRWVQKLRLTSGIQGPLIGLLVWPASDNASDYLSASGARRRLTSLAAGSEVDNPFFNVYKNKNNSRTNRILANLTLTLAPFSWGNLKTQCKQP